MHYNFLNFTFDMKKVDYKVIINKPAVILCIGGLKYVSKCHEEDEFNPEVGLMMCFTKAFGMNYRRLQNLLEKATVYTTEEIKEEEITPYVYAVQCTKKGRNFGKVVCSVDADTGKVTYGNTPLSFLTERKAMNFIKKYGLTDVAVVEIKLNEKVISED